MAEDTVDALRPYVTSLAPDARRRRLRLHGVGTWRPSTASRDASLPALRRGRHEVLDLIANDPTLADDARSRASRTSGPSSSTRALRDGDVADRPAHASNARAPARRARDACDAAERVAALVAPTLGWERRRRPRVRSTPIARSCEREFGAAGTDSVECNDDPSDDAERVSRRPFRSTAPTPASSDAARRSRRATGVDVRHRAPTVRADHGRDWWPRLDPRRRAGSRARTGRASSCDPRRT